jgi:hypothetical protein
LKIDLDITELIAETTSKIDIGRLILHKKTQMQRQKRRKRRRKRRQSSRGSSNGRGGSKGGS